MPGPATLLTVATAWVVVARAPKDRRVRTYTVTALGSDPLMAALPVWEKATEVLEKRLAPELPEGSAAYLINLLFKPRHGSLR